MFIIIPVFAFVIILLVLVVLVTEIANCNGSNNTFGANGQASYGTQLHNTPDETARRMHELAHQTAVQQHNMAHMNAMHQHNMAHTNATPFMNGLDHNHMTIGHADAMNMNMHGGMF